MQQGQGQNSQASAVLVRQHDQLEPVTWAGEDGHLLPERAVRLRSAISHEEVVIEFVNESSRPVRAIWLDFEGNEVPYTVIASKGKKKYRTYTKHPWIFRDAVTSARMMLGRSMVTVARGQQPPVQINEPPVLPWSLSAHQFFPQDFKETTSALLLAHHHVRTARFETIIGLKQEPQYNVNGSGSSSEVSVGQKHTTIPVIDIGLHSDAGVRPARCPAQSIASATSLLSDCGSTITRPHDGLLTTQAVHQLSSAWCPTDYQKDPIGINLVADCAINGNSLVHYLAPLSDATDLLDMSATLDVSSVHGDSSTARGLTRQQTGGSIATVASYSIPAGGAVPNASSYVGQQKPTNPPSLMDTLLAALRPVKQVADSNEAGPSSPGTFQKAARMLEWMADKVMGVGQTLVKTPDAAAVPTHPSQLQQTNPDDAQFGQLMSRLPTHLVLSIVKHMAPVMTQCVSNGPPASRPDIEPVVLDSDPGTWPLLPPAPQQHPPVPPNEQQQNGDQQVFVQVFVDPLQQQVPGPLAAAAVQGQQEM